MITPPTFADEIRKRLDAIKATTLSRDQRRIFDAITGPWTGIKKAKVKQSDLVKICPNLGPHPRHENHRKRKDESTERNIRELVRVLRVYHDAPILSDTRGYWVPCSQFEIDKYLNKRGSEARNQIETWLETTAAMQKIFDKPILSRRDAIQGLFDGHVEGGLF